MFLGKMVKLSNYNQNTKKKKLIYINFSGWLKILQIRYVFHDEQNALFCNLKWLENVQMGMLCNYILNTVTPTLYMCWMNFFYFLSPSFFSNVCSELCINVMCLFYWSWNFKNINKLAYYGKFFSHHRSVYKKKLVYFLCLNFTTIWSPKFYMYIFLKMFW